MAVAEGPAIVRKVGEGMDRPQAELPVDVNYAKVADFMVLRQKLPADWSSRLTAIQAKAASLSQSLAPSLLSQLPGGSEATMDYYRAVRVRDTLAATCERTLFGGLTGPALGWDKVVKAYEKNAVYMGEAALTLIQNVDYEIPYLRKQGARLSQQIVDAERRQAECKRSAATCAAAYQQECKKLGLPAGARDIKAALHGLTAELPQHLAALLGVLSGEAVQDAARYYAAFTQFAHSSTSSLLSRAPANSPAADPSPASQAGAAPTPLLGTAAEAEDAGEEVLGVLWEVVQRKTAPPPLSAATAATGTATAPAAGAACGGDAHAQTAPAGIAGPAGISWDIDVPSQDTNSAPAGISWDIGVDAGDDPTAAPSAAAAESEVAGAAVNWDISLEADASAATPVEVKWDIGVDATADAAAGEGPGTPPLTVNWDISIEAADSAAAADTTPGVDSATAHPHSSTSAGAGAVGGGGIAAGAGDGGSQPAAGLAGLHGPDACVLARLEADAEYRGLLADDLLELKAFLHQRQADLGGAGSRLLLSVMPEVLAAVDGKVLVAWQQEVARALEHLQGPRVRELLMLASSVRYVERVALALSRRAGQEAKLLAAAADAEKRKNESKAQLVALAPKVADTVQRMRELRDRLQAGMTQLLAGRQVSILGEVNNVLASTTLQ